MRHQGEHYDAGLSREMFWVLRRLTFHQKSGECHDLQRKQLKKILKTKCSNRYNYVAMIPSEVNRRVQRCDFDLCKPA